MQKPIDPALTSYIMTLEECAKYLRIHSATMYRMVKAGKIPVFRVSRHWKFRRSDIDRWRLNQQEAYH